MSTSYAGPSKLTYPIHHAEYAMPPSPTDPNLPEDTSEESDRETWSPETSPSSDISSDSSSSPPSPSSRTTKSPSSPILHPYRPKPRPGPTTNTNANTSSSSCPPKLNLPKSQPLARALFARMAMAEIPSGNGNGKKGMIEGKSGGKQKLIVATKPMRTTFELGLTASELARRA